MNFKADKKCNQMASSTRILSNFITEIDALATSCTNIEREAKKW
jgi:hypothetical protein